MPDDRCHQENVRNFEILIFNLTPFVVLILVILVLGIQNNEKLKKLSPYKTHTKNVIDQRIASLTTLTQKNSDAPQKL